MFRRFVTISEHLECAGTGVFLPRRVGNPPGMRKKSGRSTALLPARVVQALNLKLDDIGSQTQLHPRFNGSFAPDVDAAMDLMSLRFHLQSISVRRRPIQRLGIAEADRPQVDRREAV